MKQVPPSYPNAYPDMGIASLIETERPHLLQYACYRLGSPDDAEDAVQEVFLQIHARSKNRGNQPPADLRSYLYRSLSNFCTDRLRRQKIRQFIPIEQASQLSEEQVENFEQEFRLISALLAAIPEEQAEVIHLRIHGNNSFREIAEILEIPVTTVKSRFQYGIEKIRKGMNF